VSANKRENNLIKSHSKFFSSVYGSLFSNVTPSNSRRVERHARHIACPQRLKYMHGKRLISTEFFPQIDHLQVSKMDTFRMLKIQRIQRHQRQQESVQLVYVSEDN